MQGSFCAVEPMPAETPYILRERTIELEIGPVLTSAGTKSSGDYVRTYASLFVAKKGEQRIFNWRSYAVFICEDETVSSNERCPMLVAGGIQCNGAATVVPQSWELPPYGVPGQAVCSKCYQQLRGQALGSQGSRAA